MGLEIAEIIMDLEEAFFIEMPVDQDSEPAGTVQSFCDLVRDLYSEAVLLQALQAIEEYNGADTLDRASYRQLRLTLPQLPQLPIFGLPHHCRTMSEIKATLKQHIEQFSTPEGIANKVREIIQKRLGLADLPDLDQHLVHDLGAG